MSSRPAPATGRDARPRLDPLWQRAAVLGSLWAASEIVLGSFLHNLRVPMRGHVLTFIAVALLVAGHRTWRQRGLLWRAGLIAAAMKAVSPSAVLLGPMLAIAMEGLALELGVRLLGARPVGYLLGGVLAMSWTLLHKLASLVLVYGQGIVDLYRELLAHAEGVVGPVPLGAWGPLLALAAVNVLAGVVAAGVGLGVAPRQAGSAPAVAERAAHRPERRLPPGFRHSPTALAAAVVALLLGMLAIAVLPFGVATTLVVTAVGLSWWRYRAALRPLARAGFWFALVALTAAGGLLLQSSSGLPAPWGGLLAGGRMALRAVFVTVSFAVIGCELANPRITAWLARRGGSHLLAALEAAFAALPAAIAALPAPRELLRRPRESLSAMLPLLDDRLAHGPGPVSAPRAVHIVTGAKGTGKSTLVGETVAGLRALGVRIAGVWAPATLRRGRRTGFDVVDLATGVRRPFCRRRADADWPALCEYRIDPRGLRHGRAALAGETVYAHDLVVVDEIGPWELAGEGWAPCLNELAGTDVPLLLVVRPDLVEQVRTRWRLGDATVWQVRETSPAKLTDAILVALGQAPAAAAAGPG